MVKRLHLGRAAESGILAARLASAVLSLSAARPAGAVEEAYAAGSAAGASDRIRTAVVGTGVRGAVGAAYIGPGGVGDGMGGGAAFCRGGTATNAASGSGWPGADWATAFKTLGDALAVVLFEEKGFSAEDFALLHPGGALGRKLLTVVDLMRSTVDPAERLRYFRNDGRGQFEECGDAAVERQTGHPGERHDQAGHEEPS